MKCPICDEETGIEIGGEPFCIFCESQSKHAQHLCCDCGKGLPTDLQGNNNPTTCHECAAAYVGAAHREMDTVRSSVNYSEPLIHAWNEATTGALCSGSPETEIRVWRDKEINCPGCLSLMSAINRQEAERGNTTAEDYDEYMGRQRLEDASFALSDSLQGCRESDRIAEGLDAMGKPTGAMTEEEEQEYRLDQLDEAEKEIVNPFDTMKWGDGQAKPLETIDITPVGCQTPEGNERVNDSLNEWNKSAHDVANAVDEFLRDYTDTLTVALRHKGISEGIHQLTALVGARNRKQEAFLRAVVGKPKLYDTTLNGKTVQVTIPEN